VSVAEGVILQRMSVYLLHIEFVCCEHYRCWAIRQGNCSNIWKNRLLFQQCWNWKWSSTYSFIQWRKLWQNHSSTLELAISLLSTSLTHKHDWNFSLDQLQECVFVHEGNFLILFMMYFKFFANNEKCVIDLCSTK
jgi:hypothetical protein